MEHNEPKRIIVLTNQPFPVGLAGTNRILSYCKGFHYHGYQPEVFCFRPTEKQNNFLNSCDKGIYNGINYIYPGGTTKRVTSFWGRRKNDLIAEYSSLRLLYKTIKMGEILFIIFYGNCISVELFSILISRGFNIRIYKEESEHPAIYFRDSNNPLYLFKKWFYINKMYRYYTGLFVMTHTLRDFFLTKGIMGIKIIVVSHTVDTERFEKGRFISTMSFKYDYIAYLGPINQQKDGVLTLVESFKEVSVKYPEMQLLIAGIGTQQEEKELASLIIKLHLNERVHYLGRISFDEIPAFFHGAKLLASCRKRTFQNEYSFPTKVVEYLATGKPIVTTSTGELDFYLKDRINAFVAKKADPESVASKMIEALQDYDFAMKVAQEGKDMVKEMFDPIKQTKKIIDFCKG